MDFKEEIKPQICKQAFERSANRKDGLLLQVHHTLHGSTGDIRRTRFLYAAFSPCDELLAVADHRGSIFIIDLGNNLFWQLCKLSQVAVLAFHSQRKDELLVGHHSANLVIINSGTGAHLGSLTGHTETPFQISFNSNGHFCLSVAGCEGFIWDMRNLTQAHRLNLQPGMSIKQAVFMPVSDNILAVFQDDAIHVWAFETFYSIKQIVPDTWKSHCIRSIAFTRNGRAMVVGGASKQLVVFIVDNWTSQRTLSLPKPECSVRHLEFLPDAFDSGANKILAVLSDTGTLLFFDLNIGSLLSIETQRNITKFTCSASGKYTALNMTSGVVKIFSSSQLLKNCEKESTVPVQDKITTGDAPMRSTPENIPVDVHASTETSKSRPKKRHPNIDELAQATLDLNRLRPILREFSEYPEQYRGLIWRSILQLPCNREPWRSLAQRPLHPSAKKLSNTYTIQNKSTLACLQSVVSCLAHWSPIFGELPYLPHFIFPFLKSFHCDKFVCFEAAVTIILNWCQHWFEYLSFPPINILGMVENILSEHDMGLLSVFCKSGITSRHYAWSLLSTAFSEVLSPPQWQQLWDHVLSNPPWFLLFAVASYNICCRASLKTCASKEDFQFFFNHQNPVSMKLFLKKCYELMDKTSDENHPKQYFKAFEPLSRGNYPVFSEYPKFIVNHQKEQRDSMQREEERILKEQHDIVSKSLAREELRLRESKARLHEARLLEAEKAARAALEAEEGRLAEKRRRLVTLRRHLHAQERDTLAKTGVEILEQQAAQRCAELDRLHHQLHTQVEESAFNADVFTAEMRDHYNRLAAKKLELEQRLNSQKLNISANAVADSILRDSDLSLLRKQQQYFSDKMKEVCQRGEPQRDITDINFRLAELDSLKQRVEVSLAERAKSQQDVILETERHVQEAQAEDNLEQMYQEVDELFGRLTATVLENEKYAKNSFGCAGGSSQNPTTGDASISRSAELYKKEKSAVANAMELRKSLLSNWSLH